MMRKRMKALTPPWLKRFAKDENGSEALEMVYSMFVLVVLILCSMLIIGYALQTNQVAYAAKRMARYIEVGGTATQTEMDTLTRELLPNASNIGAHATVENVNWFNAARGQIQLRETFTVKVTAYYEVTLMNPGFMDAIGFKLPITVYVNGQSEIYWKR